MCENAGQKMISAHNAGTVPQRFFVFHGNHLLSLEGYLQSDYSTRGENCQGKERLELFFLILDFFRTKPSKSIDECGIY